MRRRDGSQRRSSAGCQTDDGKRRFVTFIVENKCDKVESFFRTCGVACQRLKKAPNIDLFLKIGFFVNLVARP
jgi:hypothetical protein